MVIFVQPQERFSGLTPHAPEQPPAPDLASLSLFETFSAGYGLENAPLGALDLMTRPRYEPDPDHNPLDVIKGTQYETDFLDNFVGSQSEKETRDIMARIDRELKQRETIARSGFMGWVAMMAAGTTDPTIFIPVAGWIARGAALSRAGRTALAAGEAAAATAGAVALQEEVLQSAQETRTAWESAWNIGGAALIGGVIGGSIGAVTSRSLSDLARRARDGLPGSLADDQRLWAQATSEVGAASSDVRGSGELKGALGAEKLFQGQDPLIRLQTSPLRASRNTVRDLAETPTTLAENAEGIPTTIGGAVETQIKMAEALLADALETMDRQFSEYYFGGQRIAAPLRSEINALTGRGRGRLSYSEFKQAVYDAMLHGDEHAIPQVAVAARALRQRVIQPLFDDAVELGALDANVRPPNDQSYVPRMWDTERISARRGDFQDRLQRWFEMGQQAAARTVERLEVEIAALRREGANARTPSGETLADLETRLRDAEDFARREPAEIRDITEQVTNRILGHEGTRVMGARDTVPGVRGALRERTLHIPTDMVRDFVIRDPEVLMRRYVRTMSADLALIRKFGSTDLAEQIRKMRDEATAATRTATTEKQRTAIEARIKADVRDLEAIRDRLRGTYALPDNPDGLLFRAGRVVRNINYLRMLGGMTISSIPDLGGIVFKNGLIRTFGAAFTPFIGGLRTFKLAAKEAKLAGTALDMVLDSRVMALADVLDDYGRGSKFERGLQSATQRFGVVSLMAPWNAALKQFVGIVAQTRIIETAQKIVAGTATRKEIEYLAAAGIDHTVAEKIVRQFASHGQADGAIKWANTSAWTDKSAVQSIRAALVREIDRTIVTPGMDKPLMMSREWGKVVFQFKTFAVASVQRTLIAGLQQRDAATLNGAMMMLGLGALSSYISGTIAGREPPATASQWTAEAFDRSGLGGWIMEANNAAEKITGGTVGVSRLTGRQASRYASRNALGSLLGPSFDTVGDMIQVTSSAASMDWTQSDTRALRKLVPLQNLFYMRQLFDKVEAATNEQFGIPKTRKRRN